MQGTIIRSDGSEHTISSLKHVRDVSLVLHAPFESLEYEQVSDEDGSAMTVVYNERAQIVNHAATQALPELAEVAGGSIRGDILVMASTDFQRLDT
jgi:hypothetical protein